MSNLRELYQQVIIDHNKNPRNYCVCEHCNHMQDGHNPLCGDSITVYVDVDVDVDVDEEQGIIKDICFQGHGCAIAMASASLMTEAVKGKSVASALKLLSMFQQLLTGGNGGNETNAATSIAANVSDMQQVAQEVSNVALGKLEVFAGVREFPIRIKCATLPWHTLKAALLSGENKEKEGRDAVSTE